MKRILFILPALLWFAFLGNAQEHTIISNGEIVLVTKWTLTDNGTLVTISITGAANINSSVITDKKIWVKKSWLMI